MTKEVAEFAHDLHSGLSSYTVPEFDDLHTIGMAATLAIHIRGLGEIEYEILRRVSDHFMSIPSMALEKVLAVLEEVGFVQLVRSGRKIAKVEPPQLNWSALMFRKRRTKNGKQATEARRDSFEVTAS